MVSAVLALTACMATHVHYGPAKYPALYGVPWVLAQPQAPAILGFLVKAPRRPALVLPRHGARIVWSAGGTLVARRIDGRGFVHIPVHGSVDGAVSEPRFPAGGCWRLTLRTHSGTASVVARVRG